MFKTYLYNFIVIKINIHNNSNDLYDPIKNIF